MRNHLSFLLLLLTVLGNTANAREKINIAAAADLKFALDEVVREYIGKNPGALIEVSYGSSGKFYQQVRNDAPFDLYFSADIDYPHSLAKEGFTAGDVIPYAVGRIVLWSTTQDASKLTLADLDGPKVKKLAIANPRHAPYGKRAQEALESAGLWEKLQPKLVLGENISHTAHFVQSENAQVGVIALSLVLAPELAEKGGYWLIPDSLHTPLLQGFVRTKRAQNNELAIAFSAFVQSPEARAIFTRFGFVLP